MGFMLPRRNRSCASLRRFARPLPLVVAILFALLQMLVARSSWAQRVVLVRPAQSDAILGDAFNRIQAELRLQLFEVIVIEARGADPIRSTADAANEQNALAAVSLRQQNDGATAELCIVDRATGKISLRQLTLERAQDAPAVLAIRAVDLLRTSLREFSPTEAPAPEIRDVARDAPADVSRARDWARPSQSPTSARLGVAWFDVSPHVSAAYGVDVRLDYAVAESARIGLGLLGPMIGARYRSPLGTATIRQESIALRGAYRLLQAGRFELWPSLGIGAYHLDAHAEALPPLFSKRDQVFALLAAAGLTGAIRLFEPVMLELETSAILLTPRSGVAVADHSVLFRMPIFTATLGLRTHF